MSRLDLTGMTFGNLKVIQYAGIKGRFTTWLCFCNCCCEHKEIRGSRLVTGKMKSCGCKGGDTTHGMSHAHINFYRIWQQIKIRCYNEKSYAYRNYGARGIKMCDRWHIFEYFRDDMFSTYEKGLSIERINVNGNYEPSNCIWIPRNQQAKNRTTTIWVETEQGKMTVNDAAKLAGISWVAMYQRIKQGWPKEKLLIASNFKQRISTYTKRII